MATMNDAKMDTIKSNNLRCKIRSHTLFFHWNHPLFFWAEIGHPRIPTNDVRQSLIYSNELKIHHNDHTLAPIGTIMAMIR